MFSFTRRITGLAELLRHQPLCTAGLKGTPIRLPDIHLYDETEIRQQDGSLIRDSCESCYAASPAASCACRFSRQTPLRPRTDRQARLRDYSAEGLSEFQNSNADI